MKYYEDVPQFKTEDMPSFTPEEAKRDKEKISESAMYDLFQQHQMRLNKKKRQQAKINEKLKQKKNPQLFEIATDEIDEISQDIPIDGELRRGTQLYTANCSQCHGIEIASAKKDKGPALGLIYMKQIGSDKNFGRYTSRMVNAKEHWTALNLYRFMRNPEGVIKGTKCGLMENPIHGEGDRADLIFFFREHTREMMLDFKMKQIEKMGYQEFQGKVKLRKKGKEEKDQFSEMKNQFFTFLKEKKDKLTSLLN